VAARSPVFESGAILVYLADKFSRLLPADPRARSTVRQCLFWQMSALGPMAGQTHHFVRYAPEAQDYPIARYVGECPRSRVLLLCRLRESAWLCGPEYSIADIASWPWVRGMGMIGIDPADFPAVVAWSARIGARPAIAAVAGNPALRMPDQHIRPRMPLTEEQWANLFPHGKAVTGQHSVLFQGKPAIHVH
jgi:GSH-dependent disulfide-bond oxidoreductase